MKCYINILDNDIRNMNSYKENDKRFKNKQRYLYYKATDIHVNDEIIKLIKPYIKTEKIEKKDIHFKNTRYTGIFLQNYCDYKIKYQRFLKNGFSDFYFKTLYNDVIYSANFKRTFHFRDLTDYMFNSIFLQIPYDEEKLFNNYIKNNYKKPFDVTEDVYNDFNSMTDFVLKELDYESVYLGHYIASASIYNLKENILDNCKITGVPDYIDNKGIYELKCSISDKKYVYISQVLTYACIYYTHMFDNKEFKYVKVINPILNIIHSINLDEFGKDNILKFFKLSFYNCLENKEIEIVEY